MIESMADGMVAYMWDVAKLLQWLILIAVISSVYHIEWILLGGVLKQMPIGILRNSSFKDVYAYIIIVVYFLMCLKFCTCLFMFLLVFNDFRV